MMAVAVRTYRLRVVEPFRDAEAGAFRVPGDEFEVPEERARVILGAGVAEVIAVINEAPAPAPAGEQEQKGRGKRRKG